MRGRPWLLTKHCIPQIPRLILDLVMPAEAGIQMRRGAESELDSGVRRNEEIRYGTCGGEY